MEFSGLANLDIYWLVKEIKPEIEGSWFQKMWKTELGYKMRFRSDKNVDLILAPPTAVFRTRYAYEGQEPDGFVMKIRKELRNKRLIEVKQPGFDRIVSFVFEGNVELVVELFSKGNIVLVKDGKTVVARRYETWKDREIRPGKEYKLPQSSGLDPRDMSISEFEGIFTEDSIIRSLIKNLKLGNRYAEEACVLAGENKTAKEPRDVERLYTAIKGMLDHYEPGIQDGIPVSFKLKSLAGQFEPRESLNIAVDDVMSKTMSKARPQTNNKLKKLEVRLDQQMKALERLENDAVRYKEIGDKIYERYNEVDEIFNEIRRLRKTGEDWRGIEKKLGVKILEKEGKVIIDL